MTSAGPVTGSVHARARTARHPALGVVAALALLPGGCGPGAPAALPADLSDLPITVVAADATPAATPAAPPAGDAPLPFVILFSGDGGWAPLVDGISHRLAAAGVPVVGVSSQKYFWDEREPDVIARDIARIAARYSALWGRTRFALAGFSFGADAVPFAVPLLDAADRADLDALVLISPLRDADFEFHVSSWWNRGDTGVPIAPEMAKLGTLPVVCLYGSDDAAQSLCTLPELGTAAVHEFRGDHHLGEDYDGAAKRVLDALGHRPGP